MTTPGASLPPQTTVQEDITFAGQRRINLMWEAAQLFIACTITLTNMVVATYNAMYRPEAAHPAILGWSLSLVIGFYFSRTNHASIGGVGRKPQQQEYIGR